MFTQFSAKASALVLASSACLFFNSQVNAQQVDCQDIADWSDQSVYQFGHQVVEAGNRFTANWWNTNMQPSRRSGPWQEWTRDGECLPEHHEVNIDKELMIRDLSVVDSEHAVSGELSFHHLLTQMMPQEAPTHAEKEAFVLHWLETLRVEQFINGEQIAPRPGVDSIFLDAWRAMSFQLSQGTSNALNFDILTFRLLAIVYRPDLHTRDAKGNVTSAGEARFVFGFTQPFNGGALPAKVIFEYGLDATSEAELQAWADEFHALGALEFGEQYNQQLMALTNKFTGRNASPAKPNGSALNQLRTNELPFDSPWELREFKLSAQTTMLEPVTVAQTPQEKFNRSDVFARFVNDNEAVILNGTYEIPTSVEKMAFLGGVSQTDFGAFGVPISTWSAHGIENNEARHIVSLNTCNGCHGSETSTDFSHIFERDEGEVARLSPFLTGKVFSQNGDVPFVMHDPIDTTERSFHELDDRKLILTCLLENCATAAAEQQSMLAAPRAMMAPSGLTSELAFDDSLEEAFEQTMAERFQALMQARKARAH